MITTEAVFDSIPDEPPIEGGGEELPPISNTRKIIGTSVAIIGATLGSAAVIGTSVGFFSVITGIIGLNPMLGGFIIGLAALGLIILGLYLISGMGPIGLINQIQSVL